MTWCSRKSNFCKHESIHLPPHILGSLIPCPGHTNKRQQMPCGCHNINLWPFSAQDKSRYLRIQICVIFRYISNMQKGHCNSNIESKCGLQTHKLDLVHNNLCCIQKSLPSVIIQSFHLRHTNSFLSGVTFYFRGLSRSQVIHKQLVLAFYKGSLWSC